MDKDQYERAWNAALEHAEGEPEPFEDTMFKFSGLYAPSNAFDEWYEREVINPSDGIETWG